MKKKLFPTVIIACFFIFCYSSCKNKPKKSFAHSISTTVSFGHPASGSGSCTGKGICNKVSGANCGLPTQINYTIDSNNQISSFAFEIENIQKDTVGYCSALIISDTGNKNRYTFDDSLVDILIVADDTFLFSSHISFRITNESNYIILACDTPSKISYRSGSSK